MIPSTTTTTDLKGPTYLFCPNTWLNVVVNCSYTSSMTDLIYFLRPFHKNRVVVRHLYILPHLEPSHFPD